MDSTGVELSESPAAHAGEAVQDTWEWPCCRRSEEGSLPGLRSGLLPGSSGLSAVFGHASGGLRPAPPILHPGAGRRGPDFLEITPDSRRRDASALHGPCLGAGPGLEPGSDPVPGRDAGPWRRGSGNGARMVSPAGAAPVQSPVLRPGPRLLRRGLFLFRPEPVPARRWLYAARSPGRASPAARGPTGW